MYDGNRTRNGGFRLHQSHNLARPTNSRLIHSAPSGIRTRTPFRTPAFEAGASTCSCHRGMVGNPKVSERMTGFEPATFTLAR